MFLKQYPGAPLSAAIENAKTEVSDINERLKTVCNNFDSSSIALKSSVENLLMILNSISDDMNNFIYAFLISSAIISSNLSRFLFKEIADVANFTDVKSKLYISEKAHLILPTHRLLDAVNETIKGSNKIGSTLKGIGPTYTDKISRNGIRVGDLFLPNFTEKYNALKNSHIKHIESMKFDYKSIQIDGFTFEAYEKEWLESAEELKKYIFDLVSDYDYDEDSFFISTFEDEFSPSLEIENIDEETGLEIIKTILNSNPPYKIGTMDILIRNDGRFVQIGWNGEKFFKTENGESKEITD